jgi:hypothetical protein
MPVIFKNKPAISYTKDMAAISYINKLLNYATRNMTTYELNIKSYEESTPRSKIKIKHNIFDGTIQTQAFQDFIRNLCVNYYEGVAQNKAYDLDLTDEEILIQEQLSSNEGLIGSYSALFKEFQEMCKTLNW